MLAICVCVDGERFRLCPRDGPIDCSPPAFSLRSYACLAAPLIVHLGVWYASGQSGVEKAAYFYGYSWLKALALRGGGGGRGELSTTADLGLGYLAEAFHLPFTIPIEV